jgi:hypothetical protein
MPVAASFFVLAPYIAGTLGTLDLNQAHPRRELDRNWRVGLKAPS